MFNCFEMWFLAVQVMEEQKKNHFPSNEGIGWGIIEVEIDEDDSV